jgi:alginate O-acetyltransferase complex protein AlgI
VSLFHQLVAGPIVRYLDIANEIDNRRENLRDFSYGVNRFVTGLAKKVLIANFTGEASVLFLGANLPELSTMGAWYGIALFAFQIYFDFSGYSDMAIGLGKMFGFTYKENFDHPYISRSAAEFWRRWHISLGSFFRDYVYIPLGGNRKYHIRNLLVVWLLTGLWHGASWNFILWGVYYGVFILLEKLVLNKLLSRVPGFLSHIYLLAVVLVGWVFFYFEDLGKGTAYLQAMFGLHGGPLLDDQSLITMGNNAFLFVVAALLCTPLPRVIQDKFKGSAAAREWGWVGALKIVAVPVFNFLLFLTSFILLVGQSYNPFLYFRF